MAIELPDPGNGIPEDKTGNDEWTNMKIIQENFRDPENAASKIIGADKGEIPTSEIADKATFGSEIKIIGEGDTADLPYGLHFVNSGVTGKPRDISNGKILSIRGYYSSSGPIDTQYFYSYFNDDVFMRGRRFRDETYRPWRKIWTEGNTTVDSNKNIKTSSPVLRVFKDKFEAVHEAEQLDIKFTRNDVGDYTIEGTTGLRENDWQIVIPEDEHKNQLVAFTIDEDENGTIHLKTYKRIFNFETFTFGPDLETHVDIPDGRWIDLHFNDLPQDEVIDDGSVI